MRYARTLKSQASATLTSLANVRHLPYREYGASHVGAAVPTGVRIVPHCSRFSQKGAIHGNSFKIPSLSTSCDNALLSTSNFKCLTTMQDFPMELWDKIVCLGSQADQTVLCLVSRELQDIALPKVYREIRLQSPDKAVGCCRTIMSKPSVSASVRSIVFDVGCASMLLAVGINTF
jgi:hypothetical protein